jgi:glucose/arabinose dehydrogenase
MNRLARYLAATVTLLALITYGTTAFSLQEPAAPQGRGGGRGAANNVTGDGPWDLATEKMTVRVSVVSRGLDHPWGLVFLPDGTMLVTERPGRLRAIRKGVLDPNPIAGLPEIRAMRLGGLLEIAIHPRFAENRFIYLGYSKPDPKDPARSTAAVLRARWDGGVSLTDVKDIFVADAYRGGANSPNGCCGQSSPDGSYGTRMVFDRNGFLYITVGDRNYGEKAQDPSSHLGKIVRLRDDGSVPADNPFVGKAGYKPEIFTLGHRNPLGLTIHPITREIWSTEFGARGGDELNRIAAGKNYGWFEVGEGTYYDQTQLPRGKNSVPGMEDPVLFWVPSINPGNLLFYDGDKFPEWKGAMLMTTLTRSLLRATFDAQSKPVAQERMLSRLNQRLRDVRLGSDGFLYLLTDETAGAVLRIEPVKP